MVKWCVALSSQSSRQVKVTKQNERQKLKVLAMRWSCVRICETTYILLSVFTEFIAFRIVELKRQIKIDIFFTFCHKAYFIFDLQNQIFTCRQPAFDNEKLEPRVVFGRTKKKYQNFQQQKLP
jgi:hypothetical protein